MTKFLPAVYRSRGRHRRRRRNPITRLSAISRVELAAHSVGKKIERQNVQY